MREEPVKYELFINIALLSWECDNIFMCPHTLRSRNMSVCHLFIYFALPLYLPFLDMKQKPYPNRAQLSIYYKVLGRECSAKRDVLSFIYILRVHSTSLVMLNLLPGGSAVCLCFILVLTSVFLPSWASPMAQMVKNLPAMWETWVQSESGRSLREGNGYLLQYSCLENSMDRGAWQLQSMV